MNGLWSGWFAYSSISEPVMFTAWFDDISGLLTGSILEPNTFSSFDLEDLQAEIGGTRRGTAIFFSKTYTRGQGAHGFPIAYSGQADEDFERVRGDWSFADPSLGQGPFELARSSKSISDGILRSVLAPVGR